MVPGCVSVGAMVRRNLVARAVLAAAGIAAGVGGAAADPASDPAADPSEASGGEPKGAEPRLIAPAKPAKPAKPRLLEYSHKGQLLVSARFAVGLRAIATYDNGVFCGDTDPMASSGFAPVCTGRSPFGVDFELGYGVARRVDAFLELRVGIEADFGASSGATEGPRVLHVSPGARFFFSDAGRSKLFTTAQLVIDASGYKDGAGASRGTDYGVRNLSGVWFDLDRAYGFYVFIGETATFSRWLRFELEGGVGIQGRFL